MLQKLTTLFADLEKNGISYVVWKSLENIDRALTGDDDIDVLFEKSANEATSHALRKNGFIADEGSVGTIGDDLRVFRGFDPVSAKFIMIHAHFQCRFGSKNLKEFRFPKEKEMLRNFKRYENIKILNDAFFIITRTLIAATKPKEDAYLKNLAETFLKLGDTEKQTVTSFLSPYFGNVIDSLFKSINIIGSAALDPYRGKVCATLEHVNDTPKRKRSRKNKINFPLDIALAGGDGAGKSTTAAELTKLLGRIASVKNIYLGRNRWSLPNKLINSWRTKKMLGFLNYLWPITSTKEIFARYCYGKIFKLRGGIVVYDRSLNDLQIKYAQKPLSVAWFPRLIAQLYGKNEAMFRYLLTINPQIAAERKTGLKPEDSEKIQAEYIRALPHYQVIDTAHLTPQEVASKIVSDIFSAAAHRNKRKTVLIIGTDGCGKTTLVERIVRNDEFKNKVAKLYLGENNWAFPWIEKAYRSQNKLLRLISVYILYPLDLFIRTRRITPPRAELVLIDRVPGFPFLGNIILRNIYQAAIPKTDLVVLLSGNAQTIWERKKESSFKRAERDIAKWEKIAAIFPGKKCAVDCVQNNADEVAAIIIKEISNL